MTGRPWFGLHLPNHTFPDETTTVRLGTLVTASPVVVTASDADGRRILEMMPPERRAHASVGTPEQAAEALHPYLDAGFTGFTFNNSVYRSIDQIELVGELLRLVA